MEAVYEACGRVRKPVLAELSRDILVMVTSLRPAVLIDYASLPPSALRKVLTLVQAAAAPLHGGMTQIPRVSACFPAYAISKKRKLMIEILQILIWMLWCCRAPPGSCCAGRLLLVG